MKVGFTSIAVVLGALSCGNRVIDNDRVRATDPTAPTSIVATVSSVPDAGAAWRDAGEARPDAGTAVACARGATSAATQSWRRSFGDNDVLELASVASDSEGAALIAMPGGASKFDASGTLVWSKPFGALVATNVTGDAYVAGTFSGTSDLGGGAVNAPDGTDAYVVKLDSEGAVIYSVVLGGAAEANATGLAVDLDGNAFVSGPGLGTVKLDATGRQLWGHPLSGHIAVDSQGNVLVTGGLTGTATFGNETLESAGGQDVFLAKLDGDGNFLFANRYGDAGLAQYGEAVAVDPSDDILVSGVIDGSVDFGDGPLGVPAGTCSSETWCAQAGFVAKFDPSGRHLWSRARAPIRTLPGIASDSRSNVLVSGAYPGNAPPYRLPLLLEFTSAGADLTPSNQPNWALEAAGAGRGVTFDPCDNVLWGLSLSPAPGANGQSLLAKFSF